MHSCNGGNPVQGSRCCPPNVNVGTRTHLLAPTLGACMWPCVDSATRALPEQRMQVGNDVHMQTLLHKPPAPGSTRGRAHLDAIAHLPYGSMCKRARTSARKQRCLHVSKNVYTQATTSAAHPYRLPTLCVSCFTNKKIKLQKY